MSETIRTYNEQALLHGLKAGDSSAFLELYNRYRPALYNYVLRFVKVLAIAEDTMQDVFLKIWNIRKGIDPELSFQAYLYRISRNYVFKLMKKIAVDKTLRQQVMQQLQQNNSCVNTIILRKEYEKGLHKSVLQLPPQRQKVFRLCREQGKTYEQVASELGISRNTVREHMVTAMRSIKAKLQFRYDTLLPIVIVLFL